MNSFSRFKNHPIFLLSDFGSHDSYVGQMRASILAVKQEAQVIDLWHNLPQFSPLENAYLIPPYTANLKQNGIIVAIVDPGVGSDRAVLLVETNKYIFLAPDNGLLGLLPTWYQILSIHKVVVPDGISATFHGRDLFAPLAGAVARGQPVESFSVSESETETFKTKLKEDLYRVIYIDSYGNAITGIRGESINNAKSVVRVSGNQFSHAEYFENGADQSGFWYVNSNGLVELAAYKTNFADKYGVQLSEKVVVEN